MKKIILDTDMDTDCDDAGAAAVLHALADKGEADILATFICSLHPESPLCLDAINRYYGRADLPLGALKRTGAGIQRGSRYATEIAAEFPHGYASPGYVPDALPLYRRVLAAAGSGTVTLVTIGYMSNLRYLLRSKQDEFSNLSGKELVADKVREWVCMGGRFPRESDTRECGNFRPDPEALRETLDNWPVSVPITFFGAELGKQIHTGHRLLTESPAENPVRRAYELYLKDSSNKSRHSCDQGAVLYAVRGLNDRWERHSEGSIHVFEDGTMEWRGRPNKNQSYLLRKKAPELIAKEIETLMIKPPAQRVDNSR